MNEVDRRLELARAGDPRYQPQEGIWFAWHPVRLNTGQKRWFCWVKRFKALGLFWEYFDLPTQEMLVQRAKEEADFADMLMSDRNQAFTEWRKGIISDDNLKQVVNDLRTVVDVFCAMEDRGATLHGLRVQLDSAERMYEERCRRRLGPG